MDKKIEQLFLNSEIGDIFKELNKNIEIFAETLFIGKKSEKRRGQNRKTESVN